MHGQNHFKFGFPDIYLSIVQAGLNVFIFLTAVKGRKSGRLEAYYNKEHIKYIIMPLSIML